MPSINYMNQSAPFWDFIASMEQQNPQTRAGERHGAENNENGANMHPPYGPWGWGQMFGGNMPFRGPPQHDFAQTDNTNGEEPKEKDTEMNDDNNNEKNDNGEGPSGHSGSDTEGHHRGHHGHHGRHGRCGGRRGRGGPSGFGGPCGRGGFGPRHGPPHGPPPHHHHGGPPFGPRGRWGPWGRGGPFGGGFDPSALAAHFWESFVDNDRSETKARDSNEDHTPDADVFDTESAFVIHVSLPGAKKEDVGVNWDAEKSELSVAGVIYRPGDEDFLKTLAMNERKVGPFERKIRLGTRASPAHIDVDSITAKLEDGILRVEVPKLDAGYVEIRKVDIE